MRAAERRGLGGAGAAKMGGLKQAYTHQLVSVGKHIIHTRAILTQVWGKSPSYDTGFGWALLLNLKIGFPKMVDLV